MIHTLLTLLPLQEGVAGEAARSGDLLFLFRGENLARILQVSFLLFVGIPAVYGLSRWIRARVTKRYSPQQGLIVGKVILYPGLILLLITILHQLDFSLTPLLGAAGIVGIALGFASQTSVSNVISGFFLIAEKPFQVGDMIQVGSTTGQVLSIDTLSVKLRTFDNRFVRIPNETIVKSEVITNTRFPIRRLDLNVGVAYKENVKRVKEVLLDVVQKNPKALMEPEPVVFFDAYGDSALELRLTVWTQRQTFLSLKTTLLEEIKDRFDAEGIEIPFPHLSLYTGEASKPFPLVLGSAPAAEGPAASSSSELPLVDGNPEDPSSRNGTPSDAPPTP